MLSHGCVRVQKWDVLAAWILGVDVEDVHARTKRGRNVDVPAPPIPVTLGYFTRFPDDDGTLRTFDDVYGLGPAAPSAEAGPPDTGCGPMPAAE